MCVAGLIQVVNDNGDMPPGYVVKAGEVWVIDMAVRSRPRPRRARTTP